MDIHDYPGKSIKLIWIGKKSLQWSRYPSWLSKNTSAAANLSSLLLQVLLNCHRMPGISPEYQDNVMQMCVCVCVGNDVKKLKETDKITCSLMASWRLDSYEVWMQVQQVDSSSPAALLEIAIEKRATGRGLMRRFLE